MAHTTGLFKKGHIGDPIEVIGQSIKYTIENIEFVKVLPKDIEGKIVAEAAASKRASAREFALTTVSAPGRGKQYIVAYGSTPNMPKAGYSPASFQPKLKWAKGSETLSIQATTLIKGGVKKTKFLLSKEVECMVFTSAKQLEDSIIKGLEDRNTKEHSRLAKFLKLYFSGNLKTMNTTDIDRSSLLQVAKYVGELIPGIAAFRGIDIFSGISLPLSEIKEFVIPLSSSFASVDSAIITKDGKTIQISSKAAGGADPAFIPNVIAAAQSKYLTSNTYFKKLVKHYEKSPAAGGKYVYSLLNTILGTNIVDPYRKVYENIRLYSDAKSSEAIEVVQRIKYYDFKSLRKVTAPTDDTIFKNLPMSVTAFLGRVIANNIMEDRASIDQISDIIGAIGYYQFNFKKIKEDDPKAPISISVGEAGELKFSLTAGKGMSGDITMKQGVLNFKLR